MKKLLSLAALSAVVFASTASQAQFIINRPIVVNPYIPVTPIVVNPYIPVRPIVVNPYIPVTPIVVNPYVPVYPVVPVFPFAR